MGDPFTANCNQMLYRFISSMIIIYQNLGGWNIRTMPVEKNNGNLPVEQGFKMIMRCGFFGNCNKQTIYPVTYKHIQHVFLPLCRLLGHTKKHIVSCFL